MEREVDHKTKEEKKLKQDKRLRRKKKKRLQRKMKPSYRESTKTFLKGRETSHRSVSKRSRTTTTREDKGRQLSPSISGDRNLRGREVLGAPHTASRHASPRPVTPSNARQKNTQRGCLRLARADYGSRAVPRLAR